MSFVGSSLWKVRQKWGSGPLVWPGVTVVVINSEGLIWLGKRNDTDTWSVVGGLYELGDSAESCARREIQEELGVDVTELSMIGVLTDAKRTLIKYPNGHEVQTPSHVFVANIGGATALADDEHSDFKWVSLAEADNILQGGWGFSTIALEMYKIWRETGAFQIQ